MGHRIANRMLLVDAVDRKRGGGFDGLRFVISHDCGPVADNGSTPSFFPLRSYYQNVKPLQDVSSHKVNYASCGNEIGGIGGPVLS